MRLALTLLLALAACAPAQPSPAAAPAPTPAPAASATVDPVGRYRYTSSAHGTPIEGTITIAGAPGAYTAVMTTGISPDLDIREVTVAGRRVTLATQLPQGRALIEMEVDGDRIDGRWALGHMSAPLSGTRVR